MRRKIPNFIMLLNIVRSSVLKRHSYLYMARESEQRVDVSEKITVFSFFIFERRNKICTQIIREIYMLYYEKTRMCENDGKQRPARTKICT